MKRTILLAICVSILTVLATQLALGIPLRQTSSAQIPEIISYQGLLNDNLGSPLNGNYELTVRIYNQESAGSHLWEETHATVPVNNGLFNVLLGSVNPLTVAFDEPYYMGLSINGAEELTPRLPFTSVGTAFRAKFANELAADENGNIALNGNVNVAGQVGATEYCDENGENCFSTTNVADVSQSPSALVNFDGTNCPENQCEIRSSYNVSHVERVGTGKYFIHFATPFPDNTYVGVITGAYNSTYECRHQIQSSLAEYEAFHSENSFRIWCAGNNNSNFRDVNHLSAVFYASNTTVPAGSGDSVPSGAVMPFNLSSCPSGWSAFESAQGRFVIGVGSDGEGQSYGLEDVGGEAFHQLTIDEMPSHTHDARSKHYEVYGSGSLGASHGQTPGNYETGAAGGDQPHENRPPYIALLYCEKD